jgi:hypothetical protein
MGNANEIKEIIERTKAEFLPADFEDPDGKPQVYSLEEEYDKTRKNRNYFFYGSVLIFLSAVIIAAVVATIHIQESGKQVAIDISDFEDVELKELIESSRKQQTSLEVVQRELQGVRSELNDELERARGEYDRQRELILTQGLSADERTRKLAELKRDYDARVQRINAQYAQQIAAKEQQIAKLRAELDAYNQKISTGAERADSIIKGEDELFSLRMGEVKKAYEQEIADLKAQHRREMQDMYEKYNPVFAEKDLIAIISKPALEISDADRVYLDGLDARLIREKAAPQQELNNLSSWIKAINTLNARMQRIPYENSPQRTILHTSSFAKAVFGLFDGMLRNLLTTIERQQLILSGYQAALRYMVQVQKEDGFILNAADNSRIQLHINELKSPRDGDIAWIFRTDEEKIATVRIKTLQGVRMAEVVRLEPNKQIQPFDKIMLKLVQEQ